MADDVADDQERRELLDRVHASLSSRNVREIRMFGTIAIMVDDAMAVAAHRDGSLLVRVDPTEAPQLVERPGATRAEMGSGRSMGEGWLRVDASALRGETELAEWIGCATRYLARRSAG